MINREGREESSIRAIRIFYLWFLPTTHPHITFAPLMHNVLKSVCMGVVGKACGWLWIFQLHFVQMAEAINCCYARTAVHTIAQKLDTGRGVLNFLHNT